MTAVRIEVPDGVAGPVWLAHVVRNAVQRALADGLPDERSLRVDAEGDGQKAYPASSNGSPHDDATALNRRVAF